MSEEQVKERLRSYLCLKFETENQLERLIRLKSEEKFPAMRESSGANSCTEMMMSGISWQPTVCTAGRWQVFQKSRR